MLSISFVNSCCCWNHSVEQNTSRKLLNVADTLKQKIQTNIPVFSKLCHLQQRNFNNLHLNSFLTPNFVASFVFWGTAFSLNWSIFNSETSTNLAAILKTASLHCYNHRAVIMVGWSELPANHSTQFLIIINVIILMLIIILNYYYTELLKVISNMM